LTLQKVIPIADTFGTGKEKQHFIKAKPIMDRYILHGIS
jgi:hypothetical protein